MLRLLFYLLCCLAVYANGQSICLNGGLRVNHVCICLPAFVGANCQIQIITSTTTTSSPSPTSRLQTSTSTSLPTTTSNTNSTITISMILNSILNGIIEGFVNFISYYLNLQGLGDPNLLTPQDIEILADVFVSTLINETEMLVASWGQKIPFNPSPDLTLQEKISHLTENVLYIIELDAKKMLNQSNAAETLKTMLQNLIINVLTNIENKLNLQQFQAFNSAIAQTIIGFLGEINLETLIANVTSTIETFFQNILGVSSSSKAKAKISTDHTATDPQLTHSIRKRETNNEISDTINGSLNRAFVKMLSSKLNDSD